MKQSKPKATKAPVASQTDMANAYLTAHWMDTLYTQRKWYRWTGKLWSPIHEALISREMKEFMREGYTAPMLGNVQKLVEIDLFHPDNAMDSDHDMINLDNGIYHLKKNQLLPHHSDYHITTILPFEYDAKAKCPQWERYLRSTFVLDNGAYDTEMAALVQEALGYSLTTDVSHHIMFWCYGDGSNGKGTLFHVIKQLLGSGRMELNVNGLKQNHYQVASLSGKRVATSAEVNDADKLAEDATIMSLVAGDPIQVRMISERPFEMTPTVKLWWSMNTLPSIEETTEGVWRRIRIIPFTQKFSDKNKILDLKERLNAELPGIFNWALEGLRRVRANNAICIPMKAAEVKAEYQHESNIVQVFVEDLCKRGYDYVCLKTELYAAFKKWCIDNGYKLRSSTIVRQELKRLKIYDHKTNGTWVYDGIKLLSSPDELFLDDLK